MFDYGIIYHTLVMSAEAKSISKPVATITSKPIRNKVGMDEITTYFISSLSEKIVLE